MLPVLGPKSVPYGGAFSGLLQSSGANCLPGPGEAARVPGVGVEDSMPCPALSQLWRRVVTKEGMRPVPEEACVSAGGGRREGPLQGLSGVADGGLHRWGSLQMGASADGASTDGGLRRWGLP